MDMSREEFNKRLTKYVDLAEKTRELVDDISKKTTEWNEVAREVNTDISMLKKETKNPQLIEAIDEIVANVKPLLPTVSFKLAIIQTFSSLEEFVDLIGKIQRKYLSTGEVNLPIKLPR